MASAKKNVKYVAIKLKTTTRFSLFSILSIGENIIPEIKPRTLPPIVNLQNFTKKVAKENSELLIRSANTKKKMEADPSFKSDSPSIIIFNLIFAPVDFNIATTATGSVAARIELNDMANFARQQEFSTWEQNHAENDSFLANQEDSVLSEKGLSHKFQRVDDHNLCNFYLI